MGEISTNTQNEDAPTGGHGPISPRLLKFLLTVICGVALVVSLDSTILYFLFDRFVVIHRAVSPGLAVCFACVGWGDLLVRWAKRDISMLERLLLAFGCGLGIMSLFSLGGGFGGSIDFISEDTILCGAVLCVPIIRDFTNHRRSSPQRVPTEKISFTELPVIIFLLVAITALFIFALTPPLIFDVAEYHLGAWKSYLQPDGLAIFNPMPFNFYARFPFPIESVYYLGLASSPENDAAPKIINAMCVLACAGLGSLFVRRCGITRPGQLLAALAILTFPVMLDVSVDAMIDAPVAFLVAGSFYACMAANRNFATQTTAIPSLIVPALFLFGSALSAKYTVAQIYLLPWCVVALPSVLLGTRERKIGRVILGLIIAAAPCYFWFGKNISFYGNPVEPFFVKWFRPDDLLGIAREKFYIESHFPQSPLSLSYWQTLFPRLHEFGWLFLIACAGWRFRPQRSVFFRVLIFSVLSWLLWNTVRESQNRFLLPSMILIISCAVVGVFSLPGRTLRRTAAITFLLFATAQLSLYVLKLRESGAITYILEFGDFDNAEEKPADYKSPKNIFYEKNLGHLGKAITDIHNQISRKSKLLLLYEARPYLFENPTRYNVVWDGSELLNIIRSAKTVYEAWTLIQQAGITHIFVNRQELLRYIQQYARKSQLLRLGVPPGEDPRIAWSATPHPEDLYPPFYLDPDWERLRPILHDLLDRIDQKATIREGFPVVTPGTKPLDITVTPL